MVHIRVGELPGARPHLTGATLGQAHAAAVAPRLPGLDGQHDVALLDFSGIETATASYLKAFVLALVRASQRGVLAMEANTRAENAGELPPLNCVVTVANLPVDVVEELGEVCESQGVPLYETVTWDDIGVRAVRLYGPVERALWDTLTAVAAAGPTSATDLHKTQRRVAISVTGWNNRLAELFRARLIKRDRNGRQLVYAPVADEVRRG